MTPITRKENSLDASGWLSRCDQVLNYDLCPRANVWLRWLRQPFWILVVSAIAAVLCGLFVSEVVLRLGVALVVLLVVGVVWPWWSLRAIEGSIQFTRTRGRVGELIQIEISLRNRWAWPVWGLEVERGFYPVGQQRQGFSVVCLPGWSTRQFSWNFEPTARGVYPLGQPQLECRFPFGLYTARREIRTLNELIVWPRSITLDNVPETVWKDSAEDRASDRRIGQVGDLQGTRSFRQGDSLRRVHWSQSARHGRLIVCECQLPVACALDLVLDLAPDHHTRDGARSSLEALLSVAASLLESLHRVRAHVVCTFGDEYYHVGDLGADLRQCLDAIARIPAIGKCGAVRLASPNKPYRRRAEVAKYVLTTSIGMTSSALERLDHAGARFIVVAAEANRTASLCPLSSRSNQQPCRPWLDLSDAPHALQELRLQWPKACNVN